MTNENVYDNFNTVLEDGTYKDDNNCFDLEDKITLGSALITNTGVKVSQILKLVYDLKGGLDCSNGLSVINDFDNLIKDNPLMNKISDIVICFIFSSLNIENHLADFENTIKNDVDLGDFLNKVENYKTQFDELTNFSEDVSLDDLDALLDSDLLDVDELKKDYYDENLKLYTQKFIDYLDSNFGLDLLSQNKEKLIEAFNDFGIEDFISKDDYLETLKGVFKSLFLVTEKNEGIIGESEYFLLMNLESYIDVFTNTYFSIFEFLITDFSLDFKNIKDFIFNADSKEIKQLRFLMYIFDSFKFDIMFLKKKILLELIFKSLFMKGADGYFKYYTSNEDIDFTSRQITTKTGEDVILNNMVFGVHGYKNSKDEWEYTPPELVIKNYSLRQYFKKEMEACKLYGKEFRTYEQFLNIMVENSRLCKIIDFDDKKIYDEVNKLMGLNRYMRRSSTYKTFDYIYEHEDFEPWGSNVGWSTHHTEKVYTPTEDELNGGIYDVKILDKHYLSFVYFKYKPKYAENALPHKKEIFEILMKYIDFDTELGLIEVDNSERIIDIVDDFISDLSNDLSDLYNDYFN